MSDDRRDPSARDMRRADALTAVLFRFPFSGPWGRELTEASHELAHDIAGEAGLRWKIWLEDREAGQAGGIYLFEDETSARRYREKHEHRLATAGLTGVQVDVFEVNSGLSALTMARAVLGEARAPECTSTIVVAATS